MPLTPVLDSIDLYTADTAVTRESRTHAWIEAAVAEAVEAWPVSNRSDSVEFSNNTKFNKAIKRTFKCIDRPLSHGQWHYLLNKAYDSIGEYKNDQGHLVTDNIFACPYACAVHQILVVYVSTVGVAHCLLRLHQSNRYLHQLSEGMLIANDAMMALLNPPKTAKGGAESITSKVIRSNASPQYVMGIIKLGFSHYLDHEFQFFNRQSKINYTEVTEYNEDYGTDQRNWTPRLMRGSGGSGPTDPYSGLRYKELEQLFLHALDDLIIAAETSRAQARPEADINNLSVFALNKWLNSEYKAEGKSFLHQLCLVLKPYGYSRYYCERIHHNIVSHFRKVLNLETDQRLITQRLPKCKVQQWRHQNGHYPQSMAWITSTNDQYVEQQVPNTLFTSPYVEQSDQMIMNKMSINGRFFI